MTFAVGFDLVKKLQSLPTCWNLILGDHFIPASYLCGNIDECEISRGEKWKMCVSVSESDCETGLREI